MRRIRSVLMVSVVVVGALGSAPVAFAGSGASNVLVLGCGMPELPVTGSASDRLAAATKHMKDARYYQAQRIARSVVDMPEKEATDAQRAEAHAILGWILMRSGSHDIAVKELAKAKALDASSIDTLLALRVDAKVDAEVKKALEA